MAPRLSLAPLVTMLLVGHPLVVGAQEEGFEPSEGDEEPSEPAPPQRAERPAKVSAFVFTSQEVDDRVATEVVAGLRRGINADDRLRWVDPSSAITSDDEQEVAEVERAEGLVVRAFELAAANQWRHVAATLDDAFEVFEANLAQVSRTTLVDASLLWGASQCMQRRRRACESAFRRVVTFRESVEWDPRLPERALPVFEAAREEALSGPRGSVRIESFPMGAEVFVDGRFVGAAPTRAEGLLAGDHYVSLKMLGYRRHVARITVNPEFEEAVSYDLVQLPDAPLLRDALRGARSEMGNPRVGTGTRDIWSLLFLDQIVLGDLRRVGDSERFDLALHLYDLRTSHRLRQTERRLDWSVSDLAGAEALVAELYRDVDMTGRIRVEEDPYVEPPRPREPVYRQWWLWSIVGAVVVGATIGVGSAVLPQRQPAGQGTLEIPPF